jgi:hypothetical protein
MGKLICDKKDSTVSESGDTFFFFRLQNASMMTRSLSGVSHPAQPSLVAMRKQQRSAS